MKPATLRSKLRISALQARSFSHGTRACYIANHCRCELCRRANAQYERRRRTGRGDPLADAGRARRHLLALAKLGVGKRQVADCAKVALTIVDELRRGKRQNLRRSTEARILAVTVEEAADRAYIPAAPTWKLLNQLIGRGYTKKQLASWLAGRQVRSLQLRKTRITARNAYRVRKLWNDINAGRVRR